MWMDDSPTRKAANVPPLSLTLGADGQAVSALLGVVSAVVTGHKTVSTDESVFRIADLNIGDGHIAASVVDAYRASNRNGPVRVSGTHTDFDALESARESLQSRGVLGTLDLQDASASPAAALRNRLECGGGADLVLYPHAAYPDKLPPFKLPRMVDRLGDMVAPHGAVVTLHNHGPADIDEIRSKVLGLPAHSAAGVNCNTQKRLEEGFQGAKLHSFSVTVPNTLELPANMKAIEALFIGDVSHLGSKDAADAKTIRNTLESLSGGAKELDAAIAGMDGGQRVQAVQYFGQRIKQAGGKDLPITLGGGQMVMAFRSSEVAQEAFSAVNKVCQGMTPPAIALPISRDVMPEFDKRSAHADWSGKLAQQGIVAPKVCQADLDRSR